MPVRHTMQDEVAIRQIIKDLQTAWNNRDGHAFARPFLEDAGYRVIWGFKLVGREEIARGHQDIFDNQYRNSRLEAVIENIRFIRPDVAHIEVIFRLHNADAVLPFEKSIASIVLTKTDGVWRAVTLNNAGILPRSSGEQR